MTSVFNTGGAPVSVWDTAGRLVWGETSDIPSNPTPVEPTPAPQLTVRRAVAGDVWRTGRVTTIRTTGKTYFSAHPVQVDAKDLQLSYGGNLPAGVTMPLAVAVQVKGGTRKVATFSGATSTTLSGTTAVSTDTIGITVKAGDVLEVFTYYGARSDGLAHPAAPGEWFSAEILDGNQVATGYPRFTTADRYDGYNGYRPVMPHEITGITYEFSKAWVLLGDSITESGSPSRADVAGGVYGSMLMGAYTYATAVARDNKIPFTNTAVWGSNYAVDKVGIWATIPDMKNYTHATVAWGYNDLDTAQRTGKTWETVRDTAIKTWQWVKAENPGLKMWQTTVTPSTTSTDGWTTLEGQTPVASTPMRAAFNDWLRAGAPLSTGEKAGEAGHPLTGILEISDTLSSARNSGIFRVDRGALTADGGHPNQVGHDLMRVPVDVLIGGW